MSFEIISNMVLKSLSIWIIILLDFKISAFSFTASIHYVIESGFNAVLARNQLTEQTKDVREFYNQSLSKAKKMAGTGQEVDISNMSGFSQSGPAVAKVAAEMKVQKITNFMD